MFWSAIENGGLIVISFLSLIVYSRLLSPTDFGLFSIVFALVELLSAVVTMLFHDALIQRKDVTDLDFDSAFTVTMLLSLVLVLGCWTSAPSFAEITHQPTATQILRWMSLCFPFSAVSVTLVARHRRQFAFRTLALRSLVARTIGGGVGIWAAFIGFGLWSLVIQQVLMALIGSAVLFLTTLRLPRLRVGRKEVMSLLRFGIFSTSGTLLNFSTKRIFTILAGILLGTKSAGYLNLSFRTIDMFWGVAYVAIAQVALPMLVSLRSNPDRFGRAFQIATAFSCLTLYPVFAGFAVVAPEVVQLLFGPQWLPSAPYITVLGYLVLLQTTKLFGSSVLVALGRPYAPLFGQVGELLFLLVVTWLFGMPSVARAITIWFASECIQIAIGSWILRRLGRITYVNQFRGALFPLIATGVMVGGLLLTRNVLPLHFSAIQRLSALVSAGALYFLSAICILDRLTIKDFLNFIRISLRGSYDDTVRPPSS